jgi:Na+/H+ antiporter NhaD/arsenite permease-like protein
MTSKGHQTRKTSAKITPLGRIGIIMAIILGGWLIAYALPREGEPHEVHAPRWWGVGLVPFITVLGAIAVLPLVPRTHHWWESNRNRLIVSLMCAAMTVIYYTIAEGMASVPAMLSHAIVLDYVPFIILLFALYVISGGIRLSGDLAAHPLTNTAFLAIGALLASFVGTTGASMLLIRPLLQTNSERKHVTHTVIFFIFLVSNVGGCLLPIGDPPLFLGYLRGVPFLWPFTALWKEWAFCCVALLAVYFVWDTFAYRHETKAAIRRDETRLKPLRLRGWINFLWLGGVVLAVALLDSHKTLPGTNWQPFPLLREMVMLAIVALSLLTTPRGLREANRFNYAAIAEVAALFIGIFITMQVPVAVLRAMGGELGLDQPWEFFWATGGLSSFLDNAPTYVVFFETAKTLPHDAGPGILQLPQGKFIREDLLIAISLGAVFMGANTYIGNGPNFMVKAIAEQSGVKMPTFFGYMLRYSLPILIPLFVLITVLFMR